MQTGPHSPGACLTFHFPDHRRRHDRSAEPTGPAGERPDDHCHDDVCFRHPCRPRQMNPDASRAIPGHPAAPGVRLTNAPYHPSDHCGGCGRAAPPSVGGWLALPGHAGVPRTSSDRTSSVSVPKEPPPPARPRLRRVDPVPVPWLHRVRCRWSLSTPSSLPPFLLGAMCSSSTQGSSSSPTCSSRWRSLVDRCLFIRGLVA